MPKECMTCEHKIVVYNPGKRHIKCPHFPKKIMWFIEADNDLNPKCVKYSDELIHLRTELKAIKTDRENILKKVEEIKQSFDELLGAIDEPHCGKRMVKSHIEGEYTKLCIIIQKGESLYI